VLNDQAISSAIVEYGICNKTDLNLSDEDDVEMPSTSSSSSSFKRISPLNHSILPSSIINFAHKDNNNSSSSSSLIEDFAINSAIDSYGLHKKSI
jgi:hypothetical protein